MIPIATGLAALLTLGGVPVEVSGSTAVTPAAPPADHMEVVWPTSRLAMYSSVLMNNGQRWQVHPTPRRTNTGAVVVTLKAPAPSRVQVTFTVRREHLETPIWVVGEIPAPPTGTPTEEQDDTPPGGIPTPIPTGTGAPIPPEGLPTP